MLLYPLFLILQYLVRINYAYDFVITEDSERFFDEFIRDNMFPPTFEDKARYAISAAAGVSIQTKPNHTYNFDFDGSYIDSSATDGFRDLPNCKYDSKRTINYKLFDPVCQYVYSYKLLSFDGTNMCKEETVPCPGKCIGCYGNCWSETNCVGAVNITIGQFKENYIRTKNAVNSVVFQNSSDVCYIGPAKNPTCNLTRTMVKRAIDIYNIENMGLTVDDVLSKTGENQWPNLIGSYKCIDSSGKTINSEQKLACSQGKCKGSSYFCNKFSCSANLPYTCDKDPSYAEEFAIANNAYGVFKSVGNLPIIFSRETPVTDPQQPSCYGITASCNKDHIDILRGGVILNSAKLMKDTWNIFYSFSSYKESDIEYKLRMPLEMVLSEGKVDIDIWMEGYSMPCQLSAYCKAVDVCSYNDCFWCVDSWLSVNCYTAGHWCLIVFMIFLSVYPLYYFLKLIWKIMQYIWRHVLVIRWTVHYLWLKLCQLGIWIYRKFKLCIHKVSKDKERLQYAKLEDGRLKEKQRLLKDASIDAKKSVKVEYVKQLEERHSQKKIKAEIDRSKAAARLAKLNAMTLITLVFVFFFKMRLVTGCAMITTFSVTDDACSISSTGQSVCTIKQTLVMSAAPMGQYACFTIRNPEGKIIGNTQVTFNRMNLKCQKYKMYYIPDAEPEILSHFRCDGAERCTASFCTQTNANKSLLNTISTVSNHKNGERVDGGCEFVAAGGIGTSDGCFYQQGCLFWSLGLKQRSDMVIEQYACSSWAFEMDTTVNVMSLDDAEKFDMKLIPGVSQTIQEKMSISLISASVPPTELTSRCIGQWGNIASSYNCNPRDTLIAGQMGELQCPTKDAAVSLQNCFVAGPSMKVTVNSGGAVVENKMQSVRKIFNDYTLPYSIAGGIQIYQDSDKDYYAAFSGSSLVQISMTLNGYALTYVSTKSTCSITSQSLTGCYSCATGASWNFTGRTDFGTSVATIKCPAINYITIVSLKSESQAFSLRIGMQDSQINVNCFVSCPGGDTNFVLRGNLVWIPPTDDRDNSTSTGQASKGGDASIGIQIWKNISETFFWVVGVIAIILFIIFLGYILNMCLNGKKLMKAV